MDKMKQRGVCVEVCPISNEILGLTPRMSGHAVYSLLANNVPCTISSDNGTLFRYTSFLTHSIATIILTWSDRSRLSHDFYQAMAGKADMTLHGLRQLAEWSIQHACMEPELMREVRSSWEDMWDAFCQRIVKGDFTLEDEAGSNGAEGEVTANQPAGSVPAGGVPAV